MALYTQNFTGVANGVLSGVTDWSTYQVSGSGIMSVDDAHNPAYAPTIDFSSVGEQLAIYAQPLDSSHVYCECDVMVDQPGGLNSNAIGPFLRGDAGTASATSDGYSWELGIRGDGLLTGTLKRFTDGAHTTLFASGDLAAIYPHDEEVVRRLRLEANNNWLLCYIDGDLIHARNITGDSPAYTTGAYAGVYGFRGEGSIPSQPWWDNWEAGDLPISYVNRSLLTGSEGTSTVITKPTGTAEGDLMLATITHYDTANTITAPAGWTLIGSFSDPGGSNGTFMRVWRKVAGASEPANYTFTHSLGWNLWRHGSCVTLKPNTGYAWPTNPIESSQNWGDIGDGSPMQQPGATTTAVMAFGLGVASGYDAFTPGNNSLTNWTLIGTTDSNWHGVFLRQFDAAATYTNVSHGEGETTESSVATTLVVYAEESGGPIDETSRSVTIAATITASDVLSASEQAATTLAATVTATDELTAVEQAATTIAATVTVTDTLNEGGAVPAAVTDLAGIAGNSQVVLTWTAPDDGGSPITDYAVWYGEQGVMS